MTESIEAVNKSASNISGARSDFLYGNILDQKRYMFVLDRIQNMDVLDCASGIGWGSFLMASAGAKNVVGVELSEHAVLSASKYYASSNLKYINSSLAASRLPDACFDVVASFETLEHVESPIDFLTKLRMLSRQNATMFLSTPNGYAFKHECDSPYNPYHLNEFTREELVTMFEETGWSVVEYRGQYPMVRGSDEIVEYREFIRTYWSQQKNARLFGFPYRLLSFLGRKIGYNKLSEPAFNSSCDPVLIENGYEPAYHYFTLAPVS